MDKETAYNLIKETFKNPFNEEKFIKFSTNLLDDINLENESWKTDIPLNRSINEKIKKYKIIGKYKNQDEKISIAVVELDNHRTIIKGKLLQKECTEHLLESKNNDAILVAFYSQNSDDWRFTLGKIKYKREITDKGDYKIVKELSPVRYSYLVGFNEPSHTAQMQIAPLLLDDKKNPKIDDLIRAFSVQKLTNEFFNDYKNLYEKISYELKKLREIDKKINQNFKTNNLSESDFAKKLMGQIVFLYFLQKKGWLGVKRKKNGEFNKWGDGSKNFLRKLFNKEYSDYKNFFNDILEPLFYEALGAERNSDVYSKLNCKIPFLGSGLFEPINNYNWSETDITIKNSTIKEILDTFDKFNFTVIEEEPLEVEVAIDPEMLGKVFENLLEENIRKKGGQFYTPRPIVNYMCEQSILNYLLDKTKDKIPKNEIELYVLSDHSNISKSKNIKENAEMLDNLLKNVKVCDPAVGSGAFPVSLMNIIVRLRKHLINFLERKYKNRNYYLKKDCIQNSIYGVDIDNTAIEIAKLRLWLSLIVDEENFEKIEPLPNLDFKIMQGNSLLETFHDFQLGSSMLFNENQENTFETFLGTSQTQDSLIELSKLKTQFFSSISYSYNKKLKNKIEQKIISVFKENIKARKEYDIKKFEIIETELQKLVSGELNRNFFPWSVFFSEVFLNNGGFDIIITNPPYVNTKAISKYNWRNNLKVSFGFLDDLYNHFTHLAFLLSRKGGIITFISSDTFMTLQTKRNLRNLLLKNKLISILPTPKAFKAMVNTCIFIVKKDSSNINHKINFINLRDFKKKLKKNTSIAYWENLLQPIFESIKTKKNNLISNEMFKDNLNSVIFNPSEENLKIRKKIIPELKKIHDKYWPAVKTSKAINDNKKILEEYNQNLKENSLTMLGLVTIGGQGLATGNNGNFIGCLDETLEAKRTYKQRPAKIFELIKKKEDFLKKFKEFSNFDSIKKIEEFFKSISEKQIRDFFFKIKKEFGRDIFGQGFLYKIIKKDEIAKINDLSEEEKKEGINKEKRIYVKYDKGDRQGNRWYFKTPHYLKWDKRSVSNYQTNKLARWQGYNFFFMEGFCWSDVHTVYLKCRLKEKSIHDVLSMSLFNINKKLNDKYLICLINSKFISEFQEDFLNNTSHFQINDARQMPIILPSKKKLQEFNNLFDEAKKIKIDYFEKKISKEDQEKKLDKIQTKLDFEVDKLYGLIN